MKRIFLLLLSLRAWAIPDPSMSTLTSLPNDKNAQPKLVGEAAKNRYLQILLEEAGIEKSAFVVWAGDTPGSAAWIEVPNVRQLAFVSYRVTYAQSPGTDSFCKRLEALSLFGTGWRNPNFYCY